MRTPVTRALALMLSGWAFASPAAKAGLFDDCRPRADCRRVSVAELDHLRGGFIFGGGRSPLRVSFGIAQAVVVNDELVAVTQLRLPDVGTLIASFSTHSVDLSGLASALKSVNVQALAAGAAAASVAQSGARTGVGAAAAPVAPPVPATLASSEAAATAAPALPRSGAVPDSLHGTPLPSEVLVNGKPLVPGMPVVQTPSSDELRGLIVQNGPGNIVVPSAADLKAGMTGLVIQNSLNDQTIRALTVVNVAVSVKGALSAARIQESVRQSIASSLR